MCRAHHMYETLQAFSAAVLWPLLWQCLTFSNRSLWDGGCQTAVIHIHVHVDKHSMHVMEGPMLDMFFPRAPSFFSLSFDHEQKQFINFSQSKYMVY